MKNLRGFRKLGLALALAGALAMTTPPAATATGTGSLTSWVCPYIAKAISYVESLSSSWFRDLVLRELNKLQSNYCG